MMILGIWVFKNHFRPYLLSSQIRKQVSHELDLYDQILKSSINFIPHTDLGLSKNLTPIYFPFQLVNQHHPQHHHNLNQGWP